jgi:hypothetical protein
MALKVQRHLRFAWMEFEDHRDAVMMHHTFSSGKLGWRNLLLDLPSVRTSERVNILSQFIVGEPTGFWEKLLDALFTRPLKLPGSRVSHKHAFLNVQWLSYSKQNKKTQGLIMTPASNLKDVIDLNKGILEELTPQQISELNDLLNNSINEFLGRWLLNPGVKKESESAGYLTYELDATDQADLVVASGHGGGGSVFGSMGGSRSWSQFYLSRIMRDNIGLPTTGRVKYLLVPGCTNCGDFNGEYWMPLFEKEKPYHGVLGYSGKYPGDDPGAAIVKRFTESIQTNPDLPIIEAWKRANASHPYGAFVLTAARGDTMRKWVSKEGLTVPAESRTVTFFDPAHPKGTPFTVTHEVDAIFHMADGRPIVEPNNTVQLAVQKQFGLIPGQKGHLEIKGSGSRPLTPGKKIRIVFYYWRPTKLRVNLPRLLKFDASSRSITPLTDQNKPGSFDKPQPNNRVDAIEYVIGDSDSSGIRLPYTVVADAHENKDFSADAPGVFGRFHVGIALEQDPGKFGKYVEIYTRGAYLGAP